MMCFTIESPRTSVSESTHWSPSYVFDVELMQWGVSGWPLKSTIVPGAHVLPVVRGPPFPPPSCLAIGAVQPSRLRPLKRSIQSLRSGSLAMDPLVAPAQASESDVASRAAQRRARSRQRVVFVRRTSDGGSGASECLHSL